MLNFVSWILSPEILPIYISIFSWIPSATLNIRSTRGDADDTKEDSLIKFANVCRNGRNDTLCIPVQFAKGTRSKGGGPAFVNTKP